MFQHQTVAALAGVATAVAETVTRLPDSPIGELPPTPIMRWLRERGGPIERFSQAMLLQVPADLQQDRLTAALQFVLDHHDALRLRLVTPAGNNAWSLEVAPPGAVLAAACGRRIDVSALDDAARRAFIEEQAHAAEIRLAATAGIMLQAVWFDAGSARPGRLLLTIHHLAIDGVSWRILVPDLAAAYEAIAAGRKPSLPAPGASFRHWAQRLAARAQEPAVAEELPFWTGMLTAPTLALTDRSLDPARDVVGTAGRLTLTLPPAISEALLTRVPPAFHAGINDVLLTGFALALSDWCRRHQGGADSAVLVDLERHGREAAFTDLDLSRTIGWFTSMFPVRLDAGALDPDAQPGGEGLGRALKIVKEQLRAIPGNGLGYGLLRYLNPHTGSHLADCPTPQVGFNYLGRFAAPDATDWAIADEAIDLGSGDPAMPLAHGIAVNAFTLDTTNGATLTAHWTWASALFTEDAVRELAQRWFQVLEKLARHAAQPGAGGRSPGDLPLVALAQAEIERLERRYPQFEDILPLSPLQEGLLFHALYDAQGPDIYTVQLVLDLQGSLDAAALQAAAQALTARHASLRAGFQHAGLSRPVQIIIPKVAVPWRRIDLSSLETAEHEAQLARVLGDERAARFDLAAPPLLRFALIRLAADRHSLVVTNHHLLLDGWSAPVLVRELLTLYAHQGDPGCLPRAVPYRDYLAWIAAQDRAAAISAWREALAGLQEATRLAPHDPARRALPPERVALALSATFTAALTRHARQHGLTLNTLLQVAWAILLGRQTGRDDVVFGVTVAGRPAEVAGIETMAGLFINTLPLRVTLSSDQPLLTLLEQVQDSQSRMMAHQHLGLAEIQRLAGLGELFDTLLVFENFPIDHNSLSAETGGLRLTNVSGYDATHYPLTLFVIPGDRLQLRLDFRADLFDRSSIEALVQRLVRLLEAVVAEPDRSIGSLDVLGAEERDRILRQWNETAHTIAPVTLA